MAQESPRLNIRVDVVILIIQFLVLVSAMAAGYASLKTDVENIHNVVYEHIKDSSAYLRVDQWNLRNSFVDEKLADISRKLDILILQKNNMGQDLSLAKK